tara:strand:- start:2157 stop:2456 length:300 start_codon:yes stop_codon:yes gene_type:complete
MEKEKRLENLYLLCEKRSEIILEIEQYQNEIISISERIDTLESTADHLVDKTSKDFRDQVTKARDKRKRIRETIVDLSHKVRLKEAEIKTLEMDFCNAT